MAKGEKFLCGEISVRELIAKEHSHDGSEWEGIQNPRLLSGREAQAGQIAKDQRQPGAPDGDFQNHHQEQFEADGFVHANLRQ